MTFINQGLIDAIASTTGPSTVQSLFDRFRAQVNGGLTDSVWHTTTRINSPNLQEPYTEFMLTFIRPLVLNTINIEDATAPEVSFELPPVPRAICIKQLSVNTHPYGGVGVATAQTTVAVYTAKRTKNDTTRILVSAAQTINGTDALVLVDGSANKPVESDAFMAVLKAPRSNATLEEAEFVEIRTKTDDQSASVQPQLSATLRCKAFQIYGP